MTVQLVTNCCYCQNPVNQNDAKQIQHGQKKLEFPICGQCYEIVPFDKLHKFCMDNPDRGIKK